MSDDAPADPAQPAADLASASDSVEVRQESKAAAEPAADVASVSEVAVEVRQESKASSKRVNSKRSSSGRKSVAEIVTSVAKAPSRLASRGSTLVKDIGTAISPGLDTGIGIDVLGLSAPPPPQGGGAPPPPTQSVSSYDEDDLFELDDADPEADNAMISSAKLTSPVLKEGDTQLGWAAEVLLLTHEPLRRDMLEMQRAVQPRYFGDLPESWRVFAFFRFFQAWCSLVSQQHAVEVAVHYDWLTAPAQKLDGEHRTELLSYHRKVELELLAISRLEKQIIDEISDPNNVEPWSQVAQVLRERLYKLCSEMRMHLATQESLLPEILLAHWGGITPPQLVARSRAAAKKSISVGAKGRLKPKLLMWIMHYLSRRDARRYKYFFAQLPFTTRLRLAFSKDLNHAKLLHYLRCIVTDSRDNSITAPLPSAKAGAPGAAAAGEAGHEGQRSAAMVSAVLAAANARRVDVPISDSDTTRQLADSRDPQHKFREDGAWQMRHNRVPSGLFKKMGMKEPEAPRRL